MCKHILGRSDIKIIFPLTLHIVVAIGLDIARINTLLSIRRPFIRECIKVYNFLVRLNYSSFILSALPIIFGNQSSRLSKLKLLFLPFLAHVGNKWAPGGSLWYA